MVSSARPVRVVAAMLVVVVGVAALVDLVGGPLSGRWQSPLLGFAMVGWCLVLYGGNGPSDTRERRLLWAGALCGLVAGVGGLVEALA